MKRFLLLIAVCGLLAACGLVPGDGVSTPAGTVSLAERETATQSPPAATGPATVAATATPQPSPTVAATATPVPPSPTPTTTPEADLSLAAEDVNVYPVPTLYEGDSVTFQVAPHVPASVNPADVTVRIAVADVVTLEGSLNDPNLAGDPAGVFAWAWETQGQVGTHQVVVTLDPNDTITAGDEDPDNNQVVLTVPVEPVSARPAGEANARWITADTPYATLHVVSGTAAHRDLNQLKPAVDAAAQQAIDRLSEQPERKFDVYFIDRVLGQGGYASSTMVVSYLDRDYSGGGLHELLVHEFVHLLDRQFAPKRISFLAEGLAVWASGGHYKQEDIDQRTIALRETDLFVPLPQLINDFYPHSHEIGYLQGAGFVNYLVNTYGWETVRAFYADANPEEHATPLAAVDHSLERHFDKSWEDVQADWFAYLDRLPRNRTAVTDLLTTVRYYELMREYQRHYDPTAHFLQAWLPFPQELEQRQLTAELTRHPSATINDTLETMFVSANAALLDGDHNRANVLLDSVERTLDNDGLFLDPLASNYQEIVRKLSSVGYEVHRVDLNGNEASVQVTQGSNIYLTSVNLVLRNRDWILIN